MNRPLTLTRLFLALLIALASFTLPACQAPTQTNATPEQAAPAASESHLAFRSQSRLQEHFEKHGAELGCTTPEEYLTCANEVIADPTSLHKIQREDGDDAYFRESTGEFVVVSSQGYIRTYFITDRSYFNRQ